MSEPAGRGGDLDTPPVDDVAVALEAARHPEWASEGVPMFVTVHDTRPGPPPVRSPVALAEAPRLTALFEHYDAGLAAAGRPSVHEEMDVTGVAETMTTLVVLAHHHLGAGSDDAAAYRRHGVEMRDGRPHVDATDPDRRHGGDAARGAGGGSRRAAGGRASSPVDVLTREHHVDAFSAGRFVRVVNWHAVLSTGRDRLRRQLLWYAARFDPVGPDDIDRFADTGDWHLPRRGIVLAFWDGYREHAEVVAPLCEELGLRVWFHPLTGVLDVPAEDQDDWADAHDVDLPERAPGRRWAMTTDDLDRLARAGHVLSAHTASHAAAADLTTAADVEREVTAPVRLLTDVAGRVPPAFAFLHGTPPLPGTTAGDAVLASGVRWAVTNTSLVRLDVP